MIFITQSLPVRTEWVSENGKWRIVAKVDKQPGHDYLYSDLNVYKLKNNGKWTNEVSRKHYPAYLIGKINEFQIAIATRKKEYLEGVKV